MVSRDAHPLQREFLDHFYENDSCGVKPDLFDWLRSRRQDAVNDWLLLRNRVGEEQLDADRENQEIKFLETKYGRYFADFPAAEVKKEKSPWVDSKQKMTTVSSADNSSPRCTQSTCRRPLPYYGSSMSSKYPRCGVCSADIDRAVLEGKKADFEISYHCEKCQNDICISCSRGRSERVCGTCENVVGLPPTDKLAMSTKFCCWVCESDQDGRRRNKLQSSRRKGKQRLEFRCTECTTAICVECAKPYTYPFDPDSGVVRNWWYKFLDNVWDPPEAHGGLEKYLRRERRLGLPQFELEDLYTPAYMVDPDDDDTALYDRVAPKKIPTGTTPPDMVDFESPGQGHAMVVEKNAAQTHFTKKHYPDRKNHYHKVRRVDFGHETPPPQGYDDFWYTENNRRLYDLSCEWSEKYFAKRNFPVRYRDKTWLTRLNDQFIQYANIVAHEDPFFGPKFGGRTDGWEHIVGDRKNRKWLIVSILAQIIEKRIYVELLFGANDEQARHLEQQDSDNINKDGYQRAAARSQSINLMLGQQVVPDRFQQRVDDLTAYTAKIFQDIFALANIRDEGDEPCRMKQKNREDDITFMYSELHFIISHAAYFAVCMRRSSSVFHFLSATPAARMDYTSEGQACYDLYKLSKEHSEELERVENSKDKEEMQKLEKSPGRSAKDIEEAKKAIRFRAHYRIRGAKIKFAVWPMITRYKAENVGQPIIRPSHFSRFYDPDSRINSPSQDDVEKGEGQRIVDIGKCVVVYYQGIIYPKPGPATVLFEDDGRPLLVYLQSERLNRPTDIWKYLGKVQFIAKVLAVALVMVSYRQRQWLRENWLAAFFTIAVLVVFYTATTRTQLRDMFRTAVIPALAVVIFGGIQRTSVSLGYTQLYGLFDNMCALALSHQWLSSGVALLLLLSGVTIPQTRNFTAALSLTVGLLLLIGSGWGQIQNVIPYFRFVWGQLEAPKASLLS